MNLSVILKNFTRQIEAEGSLRAMRWLVDRANTRFQEWRLGIRTEGMIELSELGISNEECKYYSPTEYAGFSQIIHALDINVRDHVFLDFGAGLGRAMILAASYSFRRVVGVEISPELSAKAHENFTRCKRKLRCQNLELVTSDATLFQIPPDVSLVYFNNPFFGKILSSVLANLHNSIKAAPREMIVVCNLPHNSAFEPEILGENWLHLKQQFTLENDRRCLIFLATPVGNKPHLSPRLDAPAKTL